MKLNNKHIAYRFLLDDRFAWEITESMHPKIKDLNASNMRPDDPHIESAAQTFSTVAPAGQKAYYITNTVFDKLDMLKVSKSKTMPIRRQNSHEIIGEVKTFDWSVFKNTPEIMTPGAVRKYTFILPDNKLLRLQTSNGYMAFFYLWTEDSSALIESFPTVGWCMFWNNIEANQVCEHWTHKDVQGVEEFIYKLLCFIYLSSNEEQLVQPGKKHGTRKSGKIVNELTIPVTVVTSKWNITSIRTEGFDVSGHFRLQPTNSGTKMIFIEPFRKHGYTRRAKSSTQ